MSPCHDIHVTELIFMKNHWCLSVYNKGSIIALVKLFHWKHHLLAKTWENMTLNPSKRYLISNHCNEYAKKSHSLLTYHLTRFNASSLYFVFISNVHQCSRDIFEPDASGRACLTCSVRSNQNVLTLHALHVMLIAINNWKVKNVQPLDEYIGQYTTQPSLLLVIYVQQSFNYYAKLK